MVFVVVYTPRTINGKVFLEQLRSYMAMSCLSGMLTTTILHRLETFLPLVVGPSLMPNNIRVTFLFAA